MNDLKCIIAQIVKKKSFYVHGRLWQGIGFFLFDLYQILEFY